MPGGMNRRRGALGARVAYPAAMDVATFLGRHPPFDALDEPALARVANGVQIEHFAPGDVILEQAGEPSRFLYVIRKGEVEILDDGRVIDLMASGEAFG